MKLRAPFMSLEFMALVAISLTYGVVIAQASGATAPDQSSLISMTLVAVAISTAVMALRARLFLLVLPTSTFLTTGIEAAGAGGLPLVYGLTLFLGAFQALFSLLIHRIKGVFSADLGFLVVCLLGFMVGGVGIDRFFSATEGGAPSLEVWIGIGTLILLYTLRSLPQREVQKMAFIGAIIAGYIVTWVCDLMPTDSLKAIGEASWFSVPSLAPGGWAFSWSYAIPLIIVAFVTTIINIGSVAGLQEAMNPDWCGCDTKTASRGCEASAAGSLAAGLLGSIGFSASATSMALSVSTKTFDRTIGFWCALLCLVLAFLSKVTTILVFIPNLVVGAALIYFGGVLLIDALKYLTASIKKPRDAFALYLPLLLGLALQVYPEQISTVTKAAHLSYGSNLAYVVILAFFLKLINRRRPTLSAQ